MKSAVLALAMGGLFAAPLSSMAGVETKEGKTLVEQTKKSYISGDFGVAVTNAYLSRGVLQEDTGLIAQPYLDLYIKMYEGDGFLNSITLNLGLWASLHSAKTAAVPGTSLPAFYEFDWLPGLSFVFAKNFTFTASWYEFDFISAEARSGNLNLNLAYNDTDLLGAFALHPHIAVLKGFIGNPSGLPGADHSWYYEFGIAPGFSAGPVAVTIPATVGLGDDGFYAGDTFGYASIGAVFAVPLKFVPEGYGAWTLTASGLYYYLGDNVAQVNRGETSKGVASLGIGCAF